MFNKVILAAFLLVDRAAIKYWENIQQDTEADDTPGMMDQPGSARSAK